MRGGIAICREILDWGLGLYVFESLSLQGGSVPRSDGSRLLVELGGIDDK